MSTSSVILASIGKGIVATSGFLLQNAILVILGVVLLVLAYRFLISGSWARKRKLIWAIRNHDKMDHKQRYLFKNPKVVLAGLKQFPEFWKILYHTYKRGERVTVSESADFEATKCMEMFWCGKIRANYDTMNQIIGFSDPDNNDLYCRMNITNSPYYGSLSILRQSRVSEAVTCAETKLDARKLEEYLKGRHPYGEFHYYDGAKENVSIL